MNSPKLHKILPNLVMSVAAVVPAASAALIMFRASAAPTAEVASATFTSPPTAEPTSSAISSTTKERKHATRHTSAARPAARPTAVPTAAPTRVAVPPAVPAATAAPTSAANTVQAGPAMQSAPLQAQSASTNAVSGATGR